MIVVDAQNLTKTFGDRTVVKGISFQIQQGTCFGVLGPNGAGKTTTLRMILGVSPSNSGSLTLFGQSLENDGRDIRARVGVVPQLDNLDPDFTVAENLYVYGRYFGIKPFILETRINELLDFVELGDRQKAPINTLSGGMKRRLAIARALINDPELIVLDEPTTGLDPQVRHLIWSRLRDLVDRGKTLLLTTHYMEEAERLCDEIMIMDDGKVIEQGSPASLISKQIEAEVLEFYKPDDQLTERLKGNTRHVEVGDTLYCYTDDSKTLLDDIDLQADAQTLKRRANLEDVFLKLTGHDLRD